MHPLASVSKASPDLAFDSRCRSKLRRVRYHNHRDSDCLGAPIFRCNRGATRDQVADVYLTRFDVGLGNILYVITTTVSDPRADYHSVDVQSVRWLTSWACWFHSNAFLVYKLVRFFSPGSKDTYLTTRSTLALFSTYPTPFPPRRPFTVHGQLSARS